MSAPKTQRAGARQTDFGLDARTLEVEQIGSASTPVLVVPEAAVKGCKHFNTDSGSPLRQYCEDCGGWRDRDGGNYGRWQRPRILRVGRSK